MNIQWYPGHMTKSRRMMEENLKLVDIVIELVDARVPNSSRNPDIDKMASGKHRIMVLNKSDLADPAANARWVKYFTGKGFHVVEADSVSGKGMNAITEISRKLMAEKIARLKSKGRIFVPIRAMVTGIPNVGKSTLINKYTGSAPTKTGDKPGVTRGKQWVRIKKDFELLDTPGILWPKFDDPAVGIKLAVTGAVSDEVVQRTELARILIEMLSKINPGCVEARYKIEPVDGEAPHETLARIAKARGFLLKAGELDMERAAIILLDEFRGCKLGRVSLEVPEGLGL